MAVEVYLFLLVVAAEVELAEVELVPLLDLELVSILIGLRQSFHLQNCLQIGECVGIGLVTLDFKLQFQETVAPNVAEEIKSSMWVTCQ